MITQPKYTHPLLAFLLISILTLTGCNSSLPIDVTISLKLGDDYTFDSLDNVLPGMPIPTDYDFPEIPICNIPTHEQIDTLIKQAVGEFVASTLTIDKVELTNIKLTATTGNFNDLTLLALYWNPVQTNTNTSPYQNGHSQPLVWSALPLNDKSQDTINLGIAQSLAGLGTDITLTPPQTVDFLSIIDEAATLPQGKCPSFTIDVEGRVPEQIPVWSMKVTLRVIGKLTL